MTRAPLHNSRRLDFQSSGFRRFHWTTPVHRIAERIHHPSEEGLPHRDRSDLARSLDGVALPDPVEIAHDCHADAVSFEIEPQALAAVGTLQKLSSHCPFQTINASDAIAHCEHRTGLGDRNFFTVVLNLLADDSADLVGSNL